MKTLVFMEIEEIEVIEHDGYVYDIELKRNHYFPANTIVSHNCRLRSNMIAEETQEQPGQPQLYNNSFGGGSVKVGSLGVVTINMPRLAYKNAGNEDKFFEDLSELVNDCARVNHAKRKIIEKRIEGGYLPLYSLGFMTTAKQYSTVGINGTYELCKIMGYDIVNQVEGQDFLKKVLETINDLNKKNAKQYGTLHNLEQIPAENVSVKLAEKDKILKYQTEEHQYDIYANQFIPLTTECDMLDRIRLQGMFEQYFDGGSVLHLNIDQPINDVDKMVELFEHCAEAGCIYLAVNYVMNQCEKGHMTVGAHFDTCSCGAKIKSQFSRVVGYLVKTSSWNKTRREKDFPNRVFY